MKNNLPDGTVSHQPDIPDLALVIAHACLQMDDAIIRARATADALAVTYSQVQRQLSALIVQRIAANPDYELSYDERLALGGEFAVNTLLQAAARMGYVQVRDAQFFDTEGHEEMVADIENAAR